VKSGGLRMSFQHLITMTWSAFGRDAQKRQRLSGRTSVNIQVAESRNEAELKWGSEGSGINS
jgi:hypothetical protein